MKKLCFVILILMLFPLSYPYAQQKSSVLQTFGDEDSVELFSWANGPTVYEYKVKREVIAKLAEWFPEKSNPPLGTPEAIAIVKKALRADYPKYDDFITVNLKLQKAVSPKYQNRWFYVIELNPQLNGDIQYRSWITMVILMDGTVVKPVEIKRSEHWMGAVEQVVPPDRQETAPASR
jgi:hypothetical protein